MANLREFEMLAGVLEDVAECGRWRERDVGAVCGDVSEVEEIADVGGNGALGGCRDVLCVGGRHCLAL